jgi:drug/metabolite transporter (DMT)-like permease
VQRNVSAAAVGVSLLWGSGWLFMKLGVTAFPPFWFCAVRGILAGVILIAIVRVQGKQLPARTVMWPMVVGGILLTGVSNGFTFWGQAHLSSSLAALVWCSMPFFTAIFSHFLLADQKLNAWRITGLLMGFSGVALILSAQHVTTSAGTAVGVAAIIISSVIWALALVLNKRWLPGADATTMTGVQMLAGGMFLLPLAMATESTAAVQVTPLSIFVFMMMLFGQGIVAYFCYYYLQTKVAPTNVALLSFVTPTIAVFLGVVLLNETPYWQMFAGLLAVAAGIITVNMMGQPQRAVAQ